MSTNSSNDHTNLFQRLKTLVTKHEFSSLFFEDLSLLTPLEGSMLVELAFELGFFDIVWLLRMYFEQVTSPTSRLYTNRVILNTRYEDFTTNSTTSSNSVPVPVRKYKLEDGKYYDLNLRIKPHSNLVPVIDIVKRESINLNSTGITVGYVGSGTEACVYSEFGIIFPRPNSNLMERIKTFSVNEYKFFLWGYQILTGVKSLHDQNLIHRNIKPENILFYDSDGSEVVKIGGHWNSVPVEEEDEEEDDEIFGTLGYRSPERRETKSMDVYSIGCTFLVMMTGISDEKLTALSKFGNTRDSILELIDSSKRVNKLNMDLVELVISMMSPDPTNRPTIEYCLQIVSEMYYKKRLSLVSKLFDCEIHFMNRRNDKDDDQYHPGKSDSTSFEYVD